MTSPSTLPEDAVIKLTGSNRARHSIVGNSGTGHMWICRAKARQMVLCFSRIDHARCAHKRHEHVLGCCDDCALLCSAAREWHMLQSASEIIHATLADGCAALLSLSVPHCRAWRGSAQTLIWHSGAYSHDPSLRTEESAPQGQIGRHQSRMVTPLCVRARIACTLQFKPTRNKKRGVNVPPRMWPRRASQFLQKRCASSAKVSCRRALQRSKQACRAAVAAQHSQPRPFCQSLHILVPNAALADARQGAGSQVLCVYEGVGTGAGCRQPCSRSASGGEAAAIAAAGFRINGFAMRQFVECCMTSAKGASSRR